jgi:hypothetical protein
LINIDDALLHKVFTFTCGKQGLLRVRLEYDIVIEEINSRKAELNSWKAAVSNEVRVYQDFCDRNLVLKDNAAKGFHQQPAW